LESSTTSHGSRSPHHRLTAHFWIGALLAAVMPSMRSKRLVTREGPVSVEYIDRVTNDADTPAVL
jgi:hypothetical protein